MRRVFDFRVFLGCWHGGCFLLGRSKRLARGASNVTAVRWLTCPWPSDFAKVDLARSRPLFLSPQLACPGQGGKEIQSAADGCRRCLRGTPAVRPALAARCRRREFRSPQIQRRLPSGTQPPLVGRVGLPISTPLHLPGGQAIRPAWLLPAPLAAPFVALTDCAISSRSVARLRTGPRCGALIRACRRVRILPPHGFFPRHEFSTAGSPIRPFPSVA